MNCTLIKVTKEEDMALHQQQQYKNEKNDTVCHYFFRLCHLSSILAKEYKYMVFSSSSSYYYFMKFRDL